MQNFLKYSVYNEKSVFKMKNAQTDILLEELLGIPIAQIRAASGFKDLSTWDSLTYVRLVVAVQELIGEDLTAEEIEQITSCEGLESVIAKRQQGS
jgi:acyl carrier protein